MRTHVLTLGTLLSIGFGLGCSDRDLRGRVVESPDGATYLVVDDDNGGVCDPLLVDGVEWSAAVGEGRPIEPGPHRIACGPGDSGIAFEIREGTTFHFDYWGP